jgi:hypothetical protein
VILKVSDLKKRLDFQIDVLDLFMGNIEETRSMINGLMARIVELEEAGKQKKFKYPTFHVVEYEFSPGDYKYALERIDEQKPLVILRSYDELIQLVDQMVSGNIDKLIEGSDAKAKRIEKHYDIMFEKLNLNRLLDIDIEEEEEEELDSKLLKKTLKKTFDESNETLSKLSRAFKEVAEKESDALSKWMQVCEMVDSIPHLSGVMEKVEIVEFDDEDDLVTVAVDRSLTISQCKDIATCCRELFKQVEVRFKK